MNRDFVAHRAALVDPRPFKQAIPGRVFERWQFGEISRYELWAYLERLWGSDEVARLLGLPVEPLEPETIP